MGAEALHQAFDQAGRERIERIARVPDVAMRRALFGEELAQLGDLAALWSIDVLVREVLEGSTEAQGVYDGLYQPELAGELLGEQRLIRLKDLAMEQAAHGAHHWLSSTEAAGAKREEKVDRPPDERPLGVRRADARKARGAELEKLLSDPDPKVIEHLLDSPQITETFVLKLASKRPVRPDALVVITRHPRWFSRYGIKRALLLNPYLPSPHAHNLMLYLGAKDLDAFSKEPTVAGGLRASAARLLRQRSRSSEPEQ